ncbi:MAG: PAS domain S-box protein, partial [Dehalococcoidia bacterium]|nr:PAS domain S-box protein [Dehalococcoidia bacterium]
MNLNKPPQNILRGWSPVSVIVVTTLAAIAVSIFCLASGYFSIFQNLFYIPIIIACGYYMKRGFAFSVIIACVYFFLSLAFTRELETLLQALARVLLFVIIAGIIAYLSSERKQAEQPIRENEHFVTSILNDLTTFVAVLKPNGEFILSNNTSMALFGESIEQVRGMKFYDMDGWKCSQDAQRLIKEDIERCASGEKIFRQVQVYTPNGIVWIDFSIHPVFGENGTVEYLIPEGRDITENKRVRDALSESEEKHRTLFETMAQGVVYENPAGEITAANPAAQRILGLTIDQMLRRTPIDPSWKTVHEDGSDFPRKDHPTMVSLKTGEPVNGFIMGIFNSVDEQYHWISVSTVPQFKPGEDKPYRVYTTFTDITELKLLERTLQEKNEQLSEQNEELLSAEEALRLEIAETEKARAFSEEVINAIPDGLSIADFAGNVIDMNETLLKMSGSTREEAVGRQFRADLILDAKDTELSFERLRRLEEGASVENYEMAIRTSEGNEVTLSIAQSAIKDASGKPAMALSIIRDITERKEMEERLRNTARLLAESQQMAHLGSCEWDIQTREMLCSDEFFRIYGCHPGEFAPTYEEFQERTHPDDREYVNGSVNTILRERSSADLQYRILLPDGEVRFVHTKNRVSLDEAGNSIRVSLITQDITERKQSEEVLKESEEVLKESEERFRAIFDNSIDGVLVTDLETGRLHSCNKAMCQMLGYSLDEIGDMKITDLHPEEALPYVMANIEREALVTPPLTREIPLKRKDGTIFYTEVTSSPVTFAGRLYLAGIFRDVTERKQAEENIRHTNIELEKAFEQLNASQEQLLQSAKLAAVG